MLVLLPLLLASVHGSVADKEDYSEPVRRLVRWLQGEPFLNKAERSRLDPRDRIQREFEARGEVFTQALASGSPLAYDLLIRIASGDPSLGRKFQLAVRATAERAILASPGTHVRDPLATRLLPRLHRYPSLAQQVFIDALADMSRGDDRIATACALLRVAGEGSRPPLIRAAAVRGIARLGVFETAPLVLRLMCSRNAIDRVGAVHTVSRLFHLHAEAAKVQDVRYAAPMLTVAARGLLAELEIETEPVVQSAILNALERFPMLETIDRLSTWIDTTRIHPDVRERTNEVLASLTGKPMPRRKHGDWARWWANERDTFHLRELPVVTRHAYGESRRTFYGLPIRGKRVLFILDRSGSMAGPGFEKLRDQLASALDSARKQSKFDIVLFSSFTIRWRNAWTPITNGSIAAARKFVGGSSISGGTDVLCGIGEAFGRRVNGSLRRGAPRRPDQLILITDGGDGSDRTPYEIVRRVREYNLDLRTRIDVVRLSPMGPNFMTPYLRRIAEENGGELRIVKTE